MFASRKCCHKFSYYIENVNHGKAHFDIIRTIPHISGLFLAILGKRPFPKLGNSRRETFKIGKKTSVK
jgi:hypothetical protein